MKRDKRSPMDLGPGAPLEGVRVTMVLEYSCFLTGSLSELERVKAAFESVAKDFTARCSAENVQLAAPNGVVRPMTQDEAIAFTPRKFHLDDGHGVQLCDTAHVSKRQIVTDVGKVTCKLCLRKLREQNDRLEAEVRARELPQPDPGSRGAEG